LSIAEIENSLKEELYKEYGMDILEIRLLQV
jgi:hypothetical protein